MDAYSKYQGNIHELKGTLEPVGPHTSRLSRARFVADLQITVEAGDSLTEKLSLEATSFPGVTRSLEDIGSDSAAFADKFNHFKDLYGGPPGSPLMSDDGSKYVLSKVDIPPGGGSALWNDLFGKITDRMDRDYQGALQAMRGSYSSQCRGDVAEVRSVEDFR